MACYTGEAMVMADWSPHLNKRSNNLQLRTKKKIMFTPENCVKYCCSMRNQPCGIFVLNVTYKDVEFLVRRFTSIQLTFNFELTFAQQTLMHSVGKFRDIFTLSSVCVRVRAYVHVCVCLRGHAHVNLCHCHCHTPKCRSVFIHFPICVRFFSSFY